jgi:DNA-binding MarR family transcriptional regulator
MTDAGSPTERRPSGAFRSPAQEAKVAILRTADALRRRMAAIVAPHGLTIQQYNVLRILRGSRPAGLPTLEIGERMIESTPGVTRLIDRLEDKELVHRERASDDRRVVLCWISPLGLELLGKLDGAMDELDQRSTGVLAPGEIAQLVDQLGRIRAAP